MSTYDIKANETNIRTKLKLPYLFSGFVSTILRSPANVSPKASNGVHFRAVLQSYLQGVRKSAQGYSSVNCLQEEEEKKTKKQ